MMRASGFISVRCVLVAVVMGTGALTPWAQAGQFRGRPTGPQGTPRVPPLVPPRGVPPYPPGAMSNGNCLVGDRGFILYLSDDPEFRALVEQDLPPNLPVGTLPPAQEKRWIERMKAFVPLLLRGLQSENGCIQRESIYYLAKTKDPRAVQPLFELLRRYSPDSQVAIDSLHVLALIYLDRAAIPYMVRIIDGTDRGMPYQMVLDAASGRLVDERLWRALVDRFERSGAEVHNGVLIQAIAVQAASVRDKREVVRFFRRNASRSDFQGRAAQLAAIIAAPDTLEDILNFYKAHCPGNRDDCWGLERVIQQVRDPQAVEFWQQELAEQHDPDQQVRDATKVVEAVTGLVPECLPAGEDFLDWVQDRTRGALALAGQQSVVKLLSMAPEAGPHTPLEQRAAYWERAAHMLRANSGAYSWIQYQLFLAYGPQGLRDKERALEAISLAVDNYQGRYGGAPEDWIRARDQLRGELRSDRLSATLRIDHPRPERSDAPFGPWLGQIVLPEEGLTDVTATTPFGFMDFMDASGETTTVPAEVHLLTGNAAKTQSVLFTISPRPGFRPPSSRITSVRLRLLYLPRSTGFCGLVVSALTPVHLIPSRSAGQSH